MISQVVGMGSINISHKLDGGGRSGKRWEILRLWNGRKEEYRMEEWDQERSCGR